MRAFSPLTLSNPVVHVDNGANTPAFWLLSQYLMNEFQLAQLYEPGITGDQGAEYLHQYRVSLRRCRSLLAIMADLYHSAPVHLLLQQLKALMEPTGKLRDLDVFLDPTSHDQANLNKLTPLMPFVQTERAHAFELLSVWLKGKEYRALKQAAFSSLVDCAQHPTERGLQSIVNVTRQKWALHQKKLHKRMDNIDRQSSESDLHRVRIACKKVRYLSDFAQSLPIDLQPGIPLKKLRQLQTELGEFNDSANQIVFCRDHLTPLQYEAQTCEAIAFFTEHARQQHQQRKQRIIRSLRKLSHR